MKGQFIAKLRSAKKTPKVTSVSEKIHILQGNGFVWKDLQNPDRSKLEELQKEHGLNALNVEDCLMSPSGNLILRRYSKLARFHLFFYG